MSGESSSSSGQNQKEQNKATDFTGSLVDIPLGDVCDSHFLLRKGRKNRVKLNIFNGVQNKPTSSSSTTATEKKDVKATIPKPTQKPAGADQKP